MVLYCPTDSRKVNGTLTCISMYLPFRLLLIQSVDLADLVVLFLVPRVYRVPHVILVVRFTCLNKYEKGCSHTILLCPLLGGAGGGTSPSGRGGGGFGRGRGRPGRDTALIGKTIRISQGPYKGSVTLLGSEVTCTMSEKHFISHVSNVLQHFYPRLYWDREGCN